MSDPAIGRALENFSRALERLDEGLSLPERHERTAIRIYQDVKSYMPILRQAHDYLQQRFGRGE